MHDWNSISVQYVAILAEHEDPGDGVAVFLDQGRSIA
jgi:hypothetical protein